MKKIFAFLFLIITACTASAWEQRAPYPVSACVKHSPYGFPISSKAVTPICREGYFVGYDASAKIPAYVTYTLEPQNALGCWPRTDAFDSDDSIQNGPTPSDYSNTGFDKGHAAPDGDMSWSKQVEFESFLMTNMYPQHGSLNRGIWKLLETSIRGWTVQLNQPYTVYVGAYYTAGSPVIGRNVVVPHGFYKIVVNNVTKEVAGWAFPHMPPYGNMGNDLTKFRVPVATIQQQALVKFGFPQGATEISPGREWKVDYGQLTAAKRLKCN